MAFYDDEEKTGKLLNNINRKTIATDYVVSRSHRSIPDAYAIPKLVIQQTKLSTSAKYQDFYRLRECERTYVK